MSYKLDTIITMLDEICMRLDRIEKIIDFSDEFAPEDIDAAFEKVFGKAVDKKPKLSVVKDETSNSNIIEFGKDD